MSTLVLMLTAAMAVPGNGPEMVSGEMEQGLDLSGRWEGISVHQLGSEPIEADAAHVFYPSIPLIGHYPWRILDEGEGCVRIKWRNTVWLGIYKQDGDQVTICLRKSYLGPPQFYEAGDDQEVLILHRVKSRK